MRVKCNQRRGDGGLTYKGEWGFAAFGVSSVSGGEVMGHCVAITCGRIYKHGKVKCRLVSRVVGQILVSG